MTELIPVAQWTFNLYRVTYHTSEADTVAHVTRHIVTTETHIEGEVCEDDNWPSPSLQCARWEPIQENVGRPRAIGSIHGLRLDEDGWTAGRRLAEKLAVPA